MENIKQDIKACLSELRRKSSDDDLVAIAKQWARETYWTEDGRSFAYRLSLGYPPYHWACAARPSVPTKPQSTLPAPPAQDPSALTASVVLLKGIRRLFSEAIVSIRARLHVEHASIASMSMEDSGENGIYVSSFSKLASCEVSMPWLRSGLKAHSQLSMGYARARGMEGFRPSSPLMHEDAIGGLRPHVWSAHCRGPMHSRENSPVGSRNVSVPNRPLRVRHRANIAPASHGQRMLYQQQHLSFQQHPDQQQSRHPFAGISRTSTPHTQQVHVPAPVLPSFLQDLVQSPHSLSPQRKHKQHELVQAALAPLVVLGRLAVARAPHARAPANFQG
ncbi:hypothetical protein D9611_001592 [Ephemerocybe angulata]|uniref:Uncharacterized protein n=1 Tax=Ephemerocybe angulata TaxID=980116 RepID=A0A8H5CHX0_9AGAR|nr:hypothetical protein D9611_001592 [Tulosesus angulatus]